MSYHVISCHVTSPSSALVNAAASTVGSSKKNPVSHFLRPLWVWPEQVPPRLELVKAVSVGIAKG